MTARILVTGGAGFIGSHLCEALVEDDHEVWVLDNFDPRYAPERKRRNIGEAASHPSVHVVDGDVRDKVLLGGLFSDVRFDAAVHLAARPGVRASIDDPDACYEINVRGTLRLLEAMERYDSRRLVLASTSHVYGRDGPPPVDEDAAADRPLAPYGASKRAAELMVYVYHRLYRFSAHCLRFSEVYGPRQPPGTPVHRFARLMQSGEPLPVDGTGDSARDCLYVDDAVRAVQLSLDRLRREEGSVFETINIGRGNPVSLERLLTELSGTMDLDPVLDGPTDQLEREAAACGSTDKAEEVLGFRAKVGLDEGLRRFTEWFRQAEDQNGGTPTPEVAGTTERPGRG